MWAIAESHGRRRRVVPVWWWVLAGLLALGANVVMLTTAGPASASYPGRAGTIAFQDFSGNLDPNGVETDYYSLRFVRPPGRHVATRLSCQGTDHTDFSGNGEQYCPLFGGGGPFQSYSGPYAPDSGPSWSPDGASLAFSGVLAHNDGSRTPKTGGCPGSCEAIFIAGADGSSPRLVPVAIADAEQPAFMPGGKTLVFAAKTKPGVPYDLYTVATDGSALERLTGNGASEPAPCANGSIVYAHDRDLYLRGADGRTQRLTRHGGTLPDCSRDSRTIAFVRNGALYTIYASGRDLRRLTPLHVLDGRPAFSPAGGLVAVTTTTATPGCDAGNGQITERLDLIDLHGRRRGSYLIDRQYCAVAGPAALGAVGWQPLPNRTG